MTSAIDPSLPPLTPSFPTDGSAPNTAKHDSLISTLKLEPHVEGGYFAETDRDSLRIPSPFTSSKDSNILVDSRSASTSIFYYLSPSSPQGSFHRNRARTVHTLHKGRARYVIVHADEVASSSCPGGYGGEEEGLKEGERWRGKARVETFVVGQDVSQGERLQWVVEGGKYKASFLLPDHEGGEKSEEGLLISETVVPGFEFADHDFMRMERLEALLEGRQKEELAWLIRKNENENA